MVRGALRGSVGLQGGGVGHVSTAFQGESNEHGTSFDLRPYAKRGALEAATLFPVTLETRVMGVTTGGKAAIDSGVAVPSQKNDASQARCGTGAQSISTVCTWN
jgi:hypothetical protein